MLVTALGWTSTQLAYEGWLGSKQRVPGLQSVPPAGLVKGIAAGFGGLLADIAYIRFSTYWGYWLTHGRNFHNVAPLLDLVITLDPKMRSAYEVGSIALADAGDVDGALNLLKRGAKAAPQNYWFPYQAGLILFLYSDRHGESARFFETAAALPGADPAAAFFAARMHLSSNRKDLAVATWLNIWKSSPSASLRTCAANWLRKAGHGHLLKQLEQSS